MSGDDVAMALGGLRWSLKPAHLVSTAVFDNQHSFTFADGGDRLPNQPGGGRLVCRAMADNQCPTTLGQALDHPLKRRAEQLGLVLDKIGVDRAHLLDRGSLAGHLGGFSPPVLDTGPHPGLCRDRYLVLRSEEHTSETARQSN